MKRITIYVIAMLVCNWAYGYDWDGIDVPIHLFGDNTAELIDTISDDFNYDFTATSAVATIGGKWTNFYHNAWTGPNPTVWKRDHVSVSGGNLRIRSSRTEGETVTFDFDSDYNGVSESHTLSTTNLGCITSTQRVQYPVYVECNVKIMNSVCASDVWMLSPDDTQEIDICEAYGSDRYTNSWFSPYRLHLSHHVFIRDPFADWQPSDEGSFYTDGSTIWRDDYHRIGVYWRDPWHLEYYVDGVKVRERDGVSQIDPNNHTSGTGLSKEMDIIINTEDQTWRAVSGLTPTDAELEDTEGHTFKVDWIRAYQILGTNVSVNEVNNNQVKIMADPYEDYISISSDITISQVLAYRINGTLAKSVTVNTDLYAFETYDLNKGMYILKVQLTDGSWSTHKVVKM